jgi:hypothetical protein
MAELEARMTVTRGILEVTVGQGHAKVPMAAVDALIAVLEAARKLGPLASPAPAVARPVGRPPKAAAAVPVEKRAGSIKRRSRKRVGDALTAWMRDNPGWHSEEDLLAAVVAHGMSDAAPKRALKIALGKQRDSVFATDGSGQWRLASDRTAGDPPAPKEPKRRARGRKRAVGRPGRKPKAAAPQAGEPGPKKRGRKPAAPWMAGDEAGLVKRGRKKLLGLGG